MYAVANIPDITPVILKTKLINPTNSGLSKSNLLKISIYYYDYCKEDFKSYILSANISLLLM